MTISAKPFLPPFGLPFLNPFGDQAGFNLLSLNPIALFDATNQNSILTPDGPTAPLLVDQSGFTSLPAGWTTTGDDTYSGGDVIISLGTGVIFIRNIQTNQTEMWAKYKWKASLDFDPAIVSFGSGILGGANVDNLLLGVTNSSGFKFITSYREDSGTAQNTTTKVFESGRTYDIVMRFKSATGPGNNDGIAQIWIDREFILNVNNADSDTLTSDAILLGQDSSVGAVTGSYSFSSVEMSPTGEAPNSVVQRSDLSGNGNNSIQTVETNRPTTGISTINGKNAIDFDGDDDYFVGASGLVNLPLSDHTIIFVAHLDTLDELQCLFGWNDNNGNINSQLFCFSTAGNTLIMDGTIGNLVLISDDLSNSDMIVTISVDHGNTIVTRLNGVQKSSHPINAVNSADSFLIGAELDPGSVPGNFTNIKKGESAFFPYLLNISQIQNAENLLSNKWGIPLV